MRRPTRVVQLCCDPGIAWGGTKGASVHLAEMAAALAGAGVEVVVVVTRVERHDTPAGVKVVQLPGPARGATVSERLAADDTRASWLAHLLGDVGADVLYERFALHTAAGSIAARARGVPHLVELNAALPAEAAAFRRLDEPEAAHALERQVLGAADCVLPVSEPLAGYASDLGARRTVVTPNAVDPARFPRPADAGADPPTAVLTGTLRPWHGVDALTEAWRLLGRRAPRLLVVGDGPGRERLEAVGARVTGTVPHEQVAHHLSTCQIGLAPYPAGGPSYFSPLKLFEYLAAGLATVAGSLPGVVDVVDEASAVVVPPGDPAALAAAVAGLCADGRRRRYLGRAGQCLVARRHTWAHRAAAVLDIAAEATLLHEAGEAPR